MQSYTDKDRVHLQLNDALSSWHWVNDWSADTEKLFAFVTYWALSHVSEHPPGFKQTFGFNVPLNPDLLYNILCACARCGYNLNKYPAMQIPSFAPVWLSPFYFHFLNTQSKVRVWSRCRATACDCITDRPAAVTLYEHTGHPPCSKWIHSASHEGVL